MIQFHTHGLLWFLPIVARSRRGDSASSFQTLGWWADPEEPRCYLPLQDDIASTAFWYQTEPHAPYPPLPGIEALRVD